MSLAGVVGLVVVVLVHTLFSAVGTRFLRVRMDTTWGAALYAVTALPMVLLVSTFVLTGFLGIGAPVGGTDVAVLLVVVLPLTVGFAIDIFWVPPPDEVDLPEKKSTLDGDGK